MFLLDVLVVYDAPILRSVTSIGSLFTGLLFTGLFVRSSSGGETRTLNPAVNSRLLCQIELPRKAYVSHQ